MVNEVRRDSAIPCRKRIFIVDGSWEFLEILRDFLTFESYDVTASLTVPESFDRILEFRPDLIIVDLVVFERVGWELLERVHREARTNQIPVIIISTSAELLEQAKSQVERFGGDYYLVKPFGLDDLLEKVHHAIGNPATAA